MSHKFRMHLPKDVDLIINTLQNHNFSAYCVGGCVRDAILQKKPHDYDIATSATPDDIFEIFKDFEVIGTGLEHGTVTVIINDKSYECTTYRIDGNYSDSRHPDSVKFTDDIIEDLQRRDFTINAMAYNHKIGLIDIFGGRHDIENRIIRCVGRPDERFREDPLRILRAIRFSAKLGFIVDSYTYMVMKKLIDENCMNSIAKERIMMELTSMFKSDDITSIANALNDNSYVIGKIIPAVSKMIGFDQNNPYHDYDVFTHTINALRACESDDYITRLAIFFHDIGKPYNYQDDIDNYRHFRGHGKISHEITNDILSNLRFDNKTRQEISTLVYYHDAIIEVRKNIIKRWLGKMGETQFRRLLDVRKADIKGQSANLDKTRIEKVDKILSLLDEIKQEQSCFNLKDMAINGNDLIIEFNMKPCKQIGEILNKLLCDIIDETCINDKQVLLERAKIYLENMD